MADRQKSCCSRRRSYALLSLLLATFVLPAFAQITSPSGETCEEPTLQRNIATDTPASRHQGYMMGLQSVESFVPLSLLAENTSLLTHSKIYRAWGPGMVPFSQPLLLACRKLAAKLMASMRFEGRVFLSEIGWPEHKYSDLIKLFDVPIQERCKRVCLLDLNDHEDLTDCPACSKLTADQTHNDFSGLLIVIQVHITRQSYLIGDMSNKQSHNQAWWRWTVENFREYGFEIKGGPLLQKQLVHNATIANLVPRWHNFGATQFELQVTGPDVLPFNPEKQNLLMHVLHELHEGLGWGDQYFRFGRIQENAVKQAARIQIVNMRVSVAAGLHEGLTKNPTTFEEKMAEQGLQVKVAVFKEHGISLESMKDQAEFLLYGHWRRQMWLTILAAIATLLGGLVALIRYKRWDLVRPWPAHHLSTYGELSRKSSGNTSSMLHSSLGSFARSSSGTPSARSLRGANNWSELSHYAGLLQLGVHTGCRIEQTDLHICSKGGVPWRLGEGGFGIVYKAIRNGVQEVAIKILAAADDAQLRSFKKEITTMRSLSFDRNVVQFYGACLEREYAMLVLEYMEGGDLCQAIQENSYPVDTRELSWYRKGGGIALDIAKGLVFLHQHGVVHMDVKSKNILLDKEYNIAKIGDVGLARVLGNTVSSQGYPLGTFNYAAPELLTGDRTLVTEKVDIYSFGVVLWEIVTQEKGKRGHLRPTVVPDECPAEIEGLIDRCISKESANRPTAREVHDIIENVLSRHPHEGLPLDSILHDAGSSNLDPEPEYEPSFTNRRHLLRADY